MSLPFYIAPSTEEPGPPFQVLDLDGSIRQSPTHLPSDDELRECYRLMRFVRILDEQFLNAQRQGRISFYGTCTGQEAAVLGSALALEEGDSCVQALREGAAALLRGYSFVSYVNQVFGNRDDITFGRQMPCHYTDSQHGHLSLSSPVANQVPQAVGMAYAEKIKGTDRAVLSYMGDGGTAEADFHIAMNFAVLWKAPVVFLCQNNQWAISTPVEAQSATPTIAERSAAYNMPGIRVDGNDILAVYDACKEAFTRARAGEGPAFIEALTYRVGAHSTSDDPSRYRDEDVTKVWATKRDPIERLKLYLMRKGLLEKAEDESMHETFLGEIKKHMSQAEGISPPEQWSMFTDVYADIPSHLKRQALDSGIEIPESPPRPSADEGNSPRPWASPQD